MSEFIKRLLRNPVFLTILSTGSFHVFDTLKEPTIVDKYTDRGYVIKKFNLDDSLSFDHIQCTRSDTGYSFSFITSNNEVYDRADYYFDSENNDRREVDILHRTQKKSIKRRFSDSHENYYIMISVIPCEQGITITVLFKDKDKRQKYKG